VRLRFVAADSKQVRKSSCSAQATRKSPAGFFLARQKRYSVGMLVVKLNDIVFFSIGAHSEVVCNYNPNCEGFVLDIETGEDC
jgi:hypothetical protein